MMKPLRPRPEDYQKATQLLHDGAEALLSTHSAQVPGFPFGSFTEVQRSPQGWPIFWVSGLAQHARNLQADPRACLTLVEPGVGRDRARLSWIGRAQVVSEGRDRLKEAFLQVRPEAARFLELPDFHPWEVAPEALYFIGGFGRALWLDPTALSEYHQ